MTRAEQEDRESAARGPLAFGGAVWLLLLAGCGLYMLFLSWASKPGGEQEPRHDEAWLYVPPHAEPLVVPYCPPGPGQVGGTFSFSTGLVEGHQSMVKFAGVDPKVDRCPRCGGRVSNHFRERTPYTEPHAMDISERVKIMRDGKVVFDGCIQCLAKFLEETCAK